MEELDLDYGEGLKYKGDPTDVVNIDPNDLLAEASGNPGLIVFWGTLYAEASFAASAAKQELKAIRATRGDIHRQAIINMGEKPTEATISYRVEVDSTVVSAEARYARAVAEAEKCKAVYEAIKQRRELLLICHRIVTADGSDEVREYREPVSEKPRPAVRRRGN